MHKVFIFFAYLFKFLYKKYDINEMYSTFFFEIIFNMYIEDVIIANMLADFFIAFFSVKLIKGKISYPQLLLSAFVGTCYAVMFPYVDNFIFLYKIICLLSVCAVSCSFVSFRRFILFCLTYTTISFCVGGASFGLLYALFNNGISFEWSKIVLILAIVFFWIAIRQIGRFCFRRQISASNGACATLYFKNNVLKVHCFNDTGNLLFDNLTNKPVMVLSKMVGESYIHASTRALRVCSVNSSKSLPIVVADEIHINNLSNERVYKNMPIAIADRNFEGYELIYNENAL